MALPLIVWWQWQHGWNLWLYGIELFLTLGLGVITSFFTAVMVTRLMVVTWMRRRRPKALTL